MIDVDAFQQKWAEQDRKLDLSIRLNRRLLLATSMNRVRSPLRRFAFFMGVQATIGFGGTGILRQFVYANWSEPRFALPGVALPRVGNRERGGRDSADSNGSFNRLRQANRSHPRNRLSRYECCAFARHNGNCSPGR